MKIAVVGGREYGDLKAVRRYVEKLPKDATVVTGGAAGVDRIAETTAARRGMKQPIVLEPNYERYGSKVAPMVRNSRIVKEADAVVAFWDGKSHGTADVMKKALAAKKLAWVFMCGEPPLFGG